MLCAPGARAAEARDSANALLAGRKAGRTSSWVIFRDGYLPARFAEAKPRFEELKASETTRCHLSLIACKIATRTTGWSAELTWQTWRDHLILSTRSRSTKAISVNPICSYRCPASVGEPARFSHLMGHFGSQRSKTWFRPETFLGLMRLRGIECRAIRWYGRGFPRSQGRSLKVRKYGHEPYQSIRSASQQRAHELIPGGCHTYAKGDDQFPEQAPPFIVRGSGCHVWDHGRRRVHRVRDGSCAP